jgi:hypothetical protein
MFVATCGPMALLGRAQVTSLLMLTESARPPLHHRCDSPGKQQPPDMLGPELKWGWGDTDCHRDVNSHVQTI